MFYETLLEIKQSQFGAVVNSLGKTFFGMY